MKKMLSKILSSKILGLKIQELKNLASKILGWVSSAKALQLYIARYKAQYAEAKEKKRLLVDVLLLCATIAIPIAMLGWHDDSRQKQLASLPIDKQQYKDGWQIFNLKGTFASASASQGNNSRLAENQKRWVLQCGQLQQSLAEESMPQKQYVENTYQDSLAANKGVKRKGVKRKEARSQKLLCEDGAQLSNDELSLKSQSLFYQSSNNSYKISTDTPLLIEFNQATINSTRGGVMQSNGDIWLTQDIVFNAPNIIISAQKQARLKNYANKKPAKMILEKNVLMQYKNSSKKYQSLAGRAEVTSCQKEKSQTNKKCNVFGVKSLSRVKLEKTVVLKEFPLKSTNKGNANPDWTLTAQTIVMQGKQARYQGRQKQAASLLFANGTQVFGQQGGHSITSNSGILCGNVRVYLGETILKSPCLSYNLNKQQFKLESKKLERELAQRFFKLNG